MPAEPKLREAQRVPCSKASLPSRPVPLRVPRSEASLLRHPVPPSSFGDIAARPVPVRVAFAALLPLQVPSAGRPGPKALPAAVCVSLARRLPVSPGWRESGSGIGRSLCLTLLPSSPCLPLRSCPPPFQASAGAPLGQPPGAFFGPEPALLVSGRSRPHREADRLSDSRLAQSTCG